MARIIYVFALVCGCLRTPGPTTPSAEDAINKNATKYQGGQAIEQKKQLSLSADPPPGPLQPVSLPVMNIESAELGRTRFAAIQSLDRGNALFSADKFAAAEVAYRSVVAKFASSAIAELALFNIGLCRESVRDFRGARVVYEDWLARFSASDLEAETRLRFVGVLSELAQLHKAQEQLAILKKNKDLTKVQSVQVSTRLGYVLFLSKDNRGAKKHFEKAIAGYLSLPDSAVSSDTSDRHGPEFYAAMASYYLAQLLHKKFQDVSHGSSLEQSRKDATFASGDTTTGEIPVETVSAFQVDVIQGLQKKSHFAAAAYDRYKQTIRYRQPHWATAGGYQMSQLFVELWEAVQLAPVPVSLDRSQRQLYKKRLEEKTRSLLEKAVKGHLQNIQLGKALGYTTVWTEASAIRVLEVLEILLVLSNSIHPPG